MLFEHGSSVPRGGDWVYEFSWPGERVLVTKEGSGVRIVSAVHGRDLTNRFPTVAAQVAKLGARAAAIDGTIRATEPEPGGSDAPFPHAPSPIRLIASDLLGRDDVDLRIRELTDRRRALDELIVESGILGPVAPTVDPDEMLAEARAVGADGVVAKRRQSRYRPYGRTGDWVRVALPTKPAGATDSPVRHRDPGGLGFGADDASGGRIDLKYNPAHEDELRAPFST